MSTETREMITELKERLNAHPEVAQWSVLHQVTRAWQHYLAKERPEATREVTNDLYHVTLYHRHSHPSGSGEEMMGSATVVLTMWDLERVGEKIEEGVLMASLTNNRPWSLPQPVALPEVPLADRESLRDPFAMIESFSRRLLAAVHREERVRLSAAELFFEETVSTVYNSAGVYGRQQATEFMLELTLLALAKDGQETEYFVIEKSRRLEDLPVEEIVAKNAAFARDSLVAVLPQTWHGAVVLDSSLLPELFEPIAFRATAEAAYSKISQWKLGENLFGAREVKGDPLTIAYSSTVPYGICSRVFDEEGVPGQETRVVENSLFSTYLASQRYGDYLGVPATGERGNLLLATGQTEERELLAGPVTYILKFSSNMPNQYTGDFAAEIKLGYRIDEQGNRTPIKGGSLSGNLFEALDNARYAREETATVGYRGPCVVRFEHLTISGADS